MSSSDDFDGAGDDEEDEFDDDVVDDDDDAGDDDNDDDNDDDDRAPAKGRAASSSSAAAVAAATTTPGTDRRRGKRSQQYAPALREMMYGFGDVKHPDEKTVALMEEIAVEYMSEMTRKAIKVNGRPGKVETQDLVFLIRRDAKKVDRVRDLIRARQELQEARKMLKEPTAK